MTNEIITTLHPEQDPNTNLYPNIKKQNIPDGSIDENKLDPNYLKFMDNKFINLNGKIDNLESGQPQYVDTSTNILSLTENKGVAVATDTGYWYYWDGSQYVSGGLYQSNINGNVINTNTYNSELPDINMAFSTGKYLILPDCFNNILNFADIKNKANNQEVLLIIDKCKYSITPSDTFVVQRVFFKNSCDVAIRYYIGSWSTWVFNKDYNAFYINQYSVTTFNKTDFNEIKDKDSFYYIESGAYNNITNLPVFINSTISFFLLETNILHYIDNNFPYQKVTLSNGDIYFRIYLNSWQNWTKLSSSNGRNVINVTNITELKSGFLNAYALGNCDIYIKGGSYNMLSENIPNDYPEGLPIGNNNHYYFSPMAKIQAFNTDNVTYAEKFSPFYVKNTEDNNMIFDGANIEVTNCRYCLHDDTQNSNNIQRHIISNCILKHNGNTINTIFFRAIGGGMGYQCEIILENCIFISNPPSSTPSNQFTDVEYHTAIEMTPDSINYISCNGCYFENTLGIRRLGASDQISNALICNNTFNKDVILYRDYGEENYKTQWNITKFNNIIRNQ